MSYKKNNRILYSLGLLFLVTSCSKDSMEIDNNTSKTGYDIAVFYEKDNTTYQVEISKGGDISTPIDLKTEFEIDRTFGIVQNSLDGKQITLIQDFLRSDMVFWQKSLSTNQLTVEQSLSLENADYSNPFQIFSDQGKFGYFHTEFGSENPLNELVYRLEGRGVQKLALGEFNPWNAEFFGDLIVIMGSYQNLNVEQNNTVIVDTKINEIVFNKGYSDFLITRATVLNERLYLFLNPNRSLDSRSRQYEIFELRNFERIERSDFIHTWHLFFNDGINNTDWVFKTDHNKSQVLVYGGPNQSDPAIYDFEKSDFTASLPYFDLKSKLTSMEGNDVYFSDLDVDLTNNKLVISYGFIANSLLNQNQATGGILLVDFNGNILTQIELENVPTRIVIKD